MSVLHGAAHHPQGMKRAFQADERSEALRAPEELALPGLWVRPPPAEGERGGSREAAWGVFQFSAMPPSTRRSMPVMKRLSSPARNSAARASSSALARRPSGMADAMPCSNAGRSASDTPSFSRIGVSVSPGLSTL